MPAATMLRIHFMQQWYALSDPDMRQTKKGQQWYPTRVWIPSAMS